MKRLVLLLCLCLLVVPVLGLRETFQNQGDFISQVDVIGTSASYGWVDNSATCGNSYVNVYGSAQSATFLINSVALPMTYSAATMASK